MLYQNVATSKCIVNPPGPQTMLWVAIIWSDRRSVLQATRPVLYLYEVTDGIFLRSIEDCLDENIPRLQGKRIQSLPPSIGGIHCWSPLWSSLGSPRSTSVPRRDALSENQVETTRPASSNLHISRLAGLKLDHQKCVVWGALQNKDPPQEIICKVYAFSDTICDGRDQDFGSARSHTWKCRSCTIHDTSFDVTLPSMYRDNVKAASAKTSRKSDFPGQPRIVETPEEDVGTVVEIVSSVRRQALDKVEDWKLDRLKGMRRAGLKEWDIALIWGGAQWTGYGTIRRPEGWNTIL